MPEECIHPTQGQVEVEIDEGAAQVSTACIDVVEKAVVEILIREGFLGQRVVSVTVLLTGDARLHELNQEFAGEDYVTDVLSFESESNSGFPAFEDDESNESLGDIAISIPQTKRQALEKGVSFERELAMLAIHGTLHLLGYDHASPKEERVMFGKTDDALDVIFGADA